MRIVIELDNIEKIYDKGAAEVRALRGVSLKINAGEFVTIRGSSGSGKSTLMNILGCLDRPTGGHYYLDGEDVQCLSKAALAHLRNRKLGFVFQGFNLLKRMSAIDGFRTHIWIGERRSGAPRVWTGKAGAATSHNHSCSAV